MKISILLPYKENYSPTYPGAVSLFVDATTKLSSYKKIITIFGNTEFKKKLYGNYINIKLPKNNFLQEVRKIADKKEYKIPATIDDPEILIEIKEDLIKNNIIK